MAGNQRAATGAAAARGVRGAIGAGIFFWLAMGTVMAQGPEQQTPEPRVLCGVAEGGGVERSPTGEIQVSNLAPIPLHIDLVSRGLAVEPMRIGTAEAAAAANVEIQVFELRGDERSAVAVESPLTATSAEEQGSRLQISLFIPPSEEDRRAALDAFLERLEAESRKEGRLDEFRRLSADKEALLVGLSGFQKENRVGVFELRCTYRSRGEEVWNGETQSPPVRIEVRFDGGPFDRIFAPVNEPQQNG